MEDVFAKILFAHLFGDYLLQTRNMALLKSEKSWRGFNWCTVHCLVYTVCFAIFFWTVNPLFLALVFLSHWPIDRWSLGQKWLDLIRGRNLMIALNSKGAYREAEILFAGLVYTVVDNTMHLFLLWIGIKTFF